MFVTVLREMFLLKFAESFYDIIQQRKIDDEYLNSFNFENYGGVPVLGVNKPVIIGHGISHAKPHLII